MTTARSWLRATAVVLDPCGKPARLPTATPEPLKSRTVRSTSHGRTLTLAT